MNFIKLLSLLLLISTSALCHRHNRHQHGENWEDRQKSMNAANQEAVTEGDRRSVPGEPGFTKDPVNGEDSGTTLDEGRETTVAASAVPQKGEGGKPVTLNARRFERMMEKAILKIITGDLSTADMALLESLNYGPEQVKVIREREFQKMKDELEEAERKRKIVYKDVPRREKKNGKSRTQNVQRFDLKQRSGGSTRSRAEAGYENPKPERDWEKELAYEKRSQDRKTFDYDAYNKQAVYDYENEASKTEFKKFNESLSVFDYEDPTKTVDSQSGENVQEAFDRMMEPNVVFKIRYDDSEFDSSSDEKLRLNAMRNRSPSKGSVNTFPAAATPVDTSLPVVYQLGKYHDFPKHSKHSAATTEEGLTKNLVTLEKKTASGRHREQGSSSSGEQQVVTDSSTSDPASSDVVSNVTDVFADALRNRKHQNASGVTETVPIAEGNETDPSGRPKESKYEGLEWVEDDVYRVIPEFIDSLDYGSEENDTSDYLDRNLTNRNFDAVMENSNLTDPYNTSFEQQNDPPDPVQLFMANTNISMESMGMPNLTNYQQISRANRRDQEQKTLEEIKTRILAATGRLNSSTTVHRQKLTMFSPTCEIPRNTDPETWADPFSMNMQFQLNLTSGVHVLAAKLRIYKLPQENSTSANAPVYDDEDDEKKIRISVYCYTKSLKKHRSKKRLMDTMVASLTPNGSQLALDVRQGCRFWRLNPRNGNVNGNNHGLVVQVEDMEGRPLKPSLYIQPPSCHSTDRISQDEKAYLTRPPYE